MVEEKMRHLEMIQSIITRMATNSFMLKGWTITLIVGIFALATKDANSIYFLIAYIPIMLFWVLDSYYLQLERKYRKLYEKIGKQADADLTFTLQTPSSCRAQKTSYLQSLLSVTECCFYMSFVVLVTVVWVISWVIL
ncbi:MAG: hypothetical protein LBE76_02580 [Nitrososphaerota archaeon]|jgi:hypothetical protein|nr:hypothetical protein [Nitrososphaerota archaeon]